MKDILPFVSIVIPVLNGAKDVTDCINALFCQNYPKEQYEIIIIDNGSSDNTLDVLKNFDVVVDVELLKGRAYALNTGVRLSKGDIILTTDISCIAEDDWIRNIIEGFSDPLVGCVAGEIKQVVKDRNLAISFQERRNYMSPMHAKSRKPPFLPFADGASASFRRKVFEEIGLFDEGFFKGADVEICYRMLLMSNYTIKFCENAIVWEEAEPSMYALLKQRFRMGNATILINKKFGARLARNSKKNGVFLKQLYWKATQGVSSIVKFTVIAVKSINSLDKRNEMLDQLVILAMTYAQRFGGVYGKVESILKPKKYQLREVPRLVIK